MKRTDIYSERLLYTAILTLQNHRDCKRLINDLLTPNEFNIIVQRLQIAQLLLNGLTYGEINKKTGASTATISRINKSLVYGDGGLLSVLEKIQ